jgi:hypothetical protein
LRKSYLYGHLVSNTSEAAANFSCLNTDRGMPLLPTLAFDELVLSALTAPIAHAPTIPIPVKLIAIVCNRFIASPLFLKTVLKL